MSVPLQAQVADAFAHGRPRRTTPNLDFSKGVRGKYLDRMQQGTNIVLIDPDLLDTFPDSESVNKALRTLKNCELHSAVK